MEALLIHELPSTCPLMKMMRYAIELEGGLIKLITIHCRHPASSSVKLVMLLSIPHVGLRSKNSWY